MCAWSFTLAMMAISRAWYACMTNVCERCRRVVIKEDQQGLRWREWNAEMLKAKSIPTSDYTKIYNHVFNSSNCLTFFSVTIILDPFFIAFGINLLPSMLLPLIAKKILFFFILFVSNEIPENEKLLYFLFMLLKTSTCMRLRLLPIRPEKRPEKRQPTWRYWILNYQMMKDLRNSGSRG